MNLFLKSTKRPSLPSSKGKRLTCAIAKKRYGTSSTFREPRSGAWIRKIGIYNRKVFEQSEKIEAITLLDDIKTIKSKLKKEVENIQETVRKKTGAG